MCDNEPPQKPPEIAENSPKPHPDLRKYRSVDTSSTRWSGQFLSPDDAVLNLKRHSDTDEYRWSFHTSKTDIDLSRPKCSCHDLTPDEKRHPERGDLRKHHSAETDKWSLPPDHLRTPYDLRKHLSDASGMAREGLQTARTLQVPEVMPNPKPRCTCPKPKTLSPSPDEKRSHAFKNAEARAMFSKSLTPEAEPEKKPELKKHASEDIRAPAIKRERGRLVQQKAIVGSSKKWEPKEKGAEERKAQRSRWAGMTHFSLQPEKREIKVGDPKSRSLKEKQRYSVRRSLSPEPDPQQIVRVNSRIVKRLISPDIAITTDAKWAPYEGYSPLPAVGIKKREPKRINEIKWTPYDGSISELSILEVPEPLDDAEPPIDDYHITPTCHPPPAAPRDDEDEEERARWRFLNQISPFPIYQGAWKDESPSPSPTRGLTLESFEPSIWEPIPKTPSPIQIKVTTPVHEPTKSYKEKKKKKLGGKSESFTVKDERLAPPTVIIRAASEDIKSRQRPMLTRSKALLEVPTKRIDPTKRSHSEEVPRYRHQEAHRGPSRAKSEESSRHPWDESEVRQYVTTV